MRRPGSKLTWVAVVVASFWIGAAAAGHAYAQKAPSSTGVKRVARDVEAVYYLQEAERLEAKGDRAGALDLFDRAVEADPDLPSVLLARAAFLREVSISQWLRNVWKALTVIPGNTAWAVSLLGTLMFILLWGIWGACAAYLFAQAGLKAPLLFHEAHEGNKTRFYAAALSLGGFLLGFIPALLLGGAVILPYLSRRERVPMYGMAIWAVLTYWIILWGGSFLSFPASPQVKAVVEVNENRGNRYAISMLSSTTGWEQGLSRGLALSREGYLKEAVEAYEKIGGVSGRRADRVRVNIANCWFRMGDIPRALEVYAQLKGSGLVTVPYNLSQAYREVLRFNDGDRLFEEAQKMDSDAVQRFSESGYVVADETLSPMERLRFVAGAGEVRPGMFNQLFRPLVLLLPPIATPAIGILFLGLYFWGGLGKGQRARVAFQCRRCHEVFCPTCDSGGNDGMCSQCSQPVDLKKSDDPSERVAKMINVRKRRGSQREFLKTLCVVPGLSDLASGRAGWGTTLLGLWVFCILLVLVPVPLASFNGMEPMAGIRVAAFVSLILLYFGNFVSVMRRLAKGWH